MATSIDTTAGLLDAVLGDLAIVIGGIEPAKLPDPTPCTEFDVALLRDHVIGWLTTFSAGFADSGGRAPRASLDGYHASEDASAAAAVVRQASADLTAAVRGGAAERPLWLGEAAMPGELALGMILWEYLMHGWDLARATGQPWAPPAEAVAASLEFAPAMLTEDYQGVGKPFGPAVPVPDSASPLDRLLGLSGRDPAWRPPR